MVLNLPPLNDAVREYLDFKPYKAHFVACQCEKPAGDNSEIKQVDEAAGDLAPHVVSSAAETKSEGSQTDETVANSATGDTAPTDKPDIKFPVPYRRRSTLNTSANACTNLPTEIHIPSLETLSQGTVKAPLKSEE